MHKKLGIILLSTFVISCLFLSGFTEGVSYTVEGNTTKITLKDTEYDGVVVQRQDAGEDFTFGSSGCTSDGGYTTCSKTYEDGLTSHNVTINNTENISILNLDNANITKFINFQGLTNLITLSLNNNKIQLQERDFNIPKLTYLVIQNNDITGVPSNFGQYLKSIRILDLSNNKISSVGSNAFYNIGSNNTDGFTIDLTNNLLETIPQEILGLTYRTIKLGSSLSNSIEYKNSSSPKKTILLINNPINFVEITKPSSYGHDTSYNFEWFGYSHEHPTGLTYTYTLKKNSSLEEGDTTSNTGIDISGFRNGSYEFKVCMDDVTASEDIKCAILSFTNTLQGTLKITRTPNTNPVTSRVINFSRTQTGYPTEYISGYTYSIKKTGGSTINGTTSTTSTGFDITELFPDITTGTFTFTVNLINKDNEVGATGESGFSLEIDSTLNITKPRREQQAYNNITGVNITFEWEGNSELQKTYHYTLTDNSDGSTLKNKTENVTGFEQFLGSGSYTLYVEMLRNGGGQIAEATKTIKINIPSTIEIISPSAPSYSDNDITFQRSGFSPYNYHYEYNLQKIDGGTEPIPITGGSTNQTGFRLTGLHHGTYHFTISVNSSTNNLASTGVVFEILDNIDLNAGIISNGSTIASGATINSGSATFLWSGASEDLTGYYYSITGTTFSGREYNYTKTVFGESSGTITLNDLATGRYRFTIKMLSGENTETDVITKKTIPFNVKIPARISIKSPTSGATIKSKSTTFSWTGYSDVIEQYGYTLYYGNQPVDTNNFTKNTSISRNDLKNGNYTLSVWIISGVNVAQDTVNFTVSLSSGGGGGGGSSSKSHPTNNLKLSISNESPALNEWIELIVKIDDKYTGKVTFPKLQYYSGDTEKREDIPVTSKTFVSDYSDDVRLGYVKFSSDDDGKKKLSQFIKFSKNGYYRIYAEDKDGYDEYVQFYVGKTNNTTPKTQNPTTNTGDIDNIIKQYIPQIWEDDDIDEEVYIARSCKKYTIRYSDSLMVYTSPNLNMNEYFMNKDYFKRYIDSKNKYQSGCPTNVGWISTSYSDKSNSETRYTAPNGKVYFITQKGSSYYSEELNKELKTPTSFKTIQELKYYIRDRNPLINMATLGPIK